MDELLAIDFYDISENLMHRATWMFDRVQAVIQMPPIKINIVGDQITTLNRVKPAKEVTKRVCQ